MREEGGEPISQRKKSFAFPPFVVNQRQQKQNIVRTSFFKGAITFFILEEKNMAAFGITLNISYLPLFLWYSSILWLKSFASNARK